LIILSLFKSGSTLVVDTEVDRANIKVLYLDLKSVSTHLNVGATYLLHCNIFDWF
jgi:hypothetical protein